VSLTAWRITKRKHARSAFTGKGASDYGGRWNNPGIPLIYVAQSQALAVLEMLVHLDSADLLQKYVLIDVKFDESLVLNVDRSKFPRNWRVEPPPAQIRTIGDDWAVARTSVVLRVPSALVPDESNYLINPKHPDFPQVQIGEPISYRFDFRLVK
jgi:RES domain-containing protein